MEEERHCFMASNHIHKVLNGNEEEALNGMQRHEWLGTTIMSFLMSYIKELKVGTRQH